MAVRKVLQVWAWSVLVAVATAAVFAAAIQAAQVDGSLRNVFEMTAFFGAIFATMALVVCVPGFIALSRATTWLENRAVAMSLGAGLAALASLMLVVIVFRDPRDPQTVAGWIQFWSGNAIQFTLGIAPFALGGVMFGARWTAPERLAAPLETTARTRGHRRSPGTRVRKSRSTSRPAP